MAKNLAYYRALPYSKRVSLEQDDGEYFVVEVAELPGCIATGDTRAEALAVFNEAFDAYILAHLEWGNPIPEPAPVPKARGGMYKYQEPPGTTDGPDTITKEMEMPAQG